MNTEVRNIKNVNSEVKQTLPSRKDQAAEKL